MAGRGRLAEMGMLDADDYRNTDKRIAVLGVDGTWRSPAQHPLHSDRAEVGIGPGLAFAQAIIDFLPADEQRIGLIPCAVSSASGLSRWTAPRGDLFKAAVASVQKAEAMGGVLSGVLWHHGEVDAGSSEDASHHGERLRNIISGLRNSFGIRDLPVILGELPYFLEASDPRFAYVEDVNAAILSTTGIKHVAVASTLGLGHMGDGMHFSAAAADELGRRYAWKWLEVTGHLHGSLKRLIRDALDPSVVHSNGSGVTTMLPYSSSGMKRFATRSYVVGDYVEVWNSSYMSWSRGVIEKLVDGVASVSAISPNGSMSKRDFPVDSELLRLDVQGAAQEKWFSVGQAVEVYSNSKQMWCPGVVENSGNGFVGVAFQFPGPGNTTDVLQKVLPFNSNDIRLVGSGLTPRLDSSPTRAVSSSQLGSSRSLPRLRLPHQDSPRRLLPTTEAQILSPSSGVGTPTALSPSRGPYSRMAQRYQPSDSFNAGRIQDGRLNAGSYAPTRIDPSTGRRIVVNSAQMC